MTGIILDGVLMLLLVAALGYGVRLEKKLSALRAGQLAFAGAVNDLNVAAGRAEAALASLRASGQETDLLHDRIVKARAVKGELEALCNRAVGNSSSPSPRDREETRVSSPRTGERDHDVVEGLVPQLPPPEDERALRMAALAQRIKGLPAAKAPPAPVSAILQAMTANQAAKQSLNRARRNLDEDLFAA